MIDTIFESLFQPHSEEEVELRKGTPKAKRGDTIAVASDSIAYAAGRYFRVVKGDRGQINGDPIWNSSEGDWMYPTTFEKGLGQSVMAWHDEFDVVEEVSENLFRPVDMVEHGDRIPEETYALLQEFEKDAQVVYSTEFSTKAAASTARMRLYKRYDIKDASIAWYRVYWELMSPNDAAQLQMHRSEETLVKLYKSWKERNDQ